MILEEKYTLSNGIDIPKLGLGTWFINDANVGQAVKDAVKIGYRHIDTAMIYKNEADVGGAIWNTGSEITIKDSTLNENRANNGDGGALFTTSVRSSSGNSFSKRAFDHTGITVTSMWVEPELDLEHRADR